MMKWIKKRWAVCEEGAQIVRYIFELKKQGESMNKIAKTLKKQKVYIPSVYAAKKGIRKPTAKPPLNEYVWNSRNDAKNLNKVLCR